ncbi:MAG: YkgJ family cysteine cluster protein [Bryobacteraceae bacterium]|jgi:Fe-S-cluster containining protein
MPGDRGFIQILDAALAESARRSGAWLVCKLGCTECCIGPFPITQLDAVRLREGLSGLQHSDPARAARILQRSREAVARGDQGDEDACPVLDPETGACDLYAARPVTCRTFGPPVRWGAEPLGICELNFQGATEEEIAACEVALDVREMEAGLLDSLERATGASGETSVASALLNTPDRSPAST